ncbi:hypothetical protein RHSIM_Rhsim02G0151600 [Rhododendron simsii]|uniref:Endonuclease/exonuclease/phosphatase domain-containing protein n=1 Tax=Rhododendron simsii TaxID=118357 RepID=A0A834HDN1_RHOSS|nr:hypothetical protein RHSIM_Rhsim02G0151600 [Rhododendron simsii]
MLILTWNCQGIGRSLTSQALGDLVQKRSPSIIYLMETKNNMVKLETIRHRLKFNYGSYVDPGLALWWNNDVSVDVEFSHKNLIHTVITIKAESLRWAATFVYGCPTHAGNERVWDELHDIASFERLPWLCIRDFNQVLRVSDKVGGNILDSGRIDAFHDMLNDCGLVDLECKAPRFTWRNNRTDGAFIMEN